MASKKNSKKLKNREKERKNYNVDSYNKKPINQKRSKNEY